MTEEQQEVIRFEKMAEMLKAIAHPTRVAMIKLLKGKDWLTVTEIYESLNIEQAVASQHLAVLKSKGVLWSRREGKNSYYALKHKQLLKVVQLVEDCQDC